MLSDPTLLIVEDKERVRSHLLRVFSGPSDAFIQEHRIRRFEVAVADTADSAKTALQKASDEKLPYDVILFDLGLPVSKDSKVVDNPSVGLRLLKSVDPSCCSAVVIASAHFEPDSLIDLLRLGIAHDFVRKPWDDDDGNLFRAVVAAYRSGQRKQFLRRMRVARLQHADERLVNHKGVAVANELAEIISTGFSDHRDRLLALVEEIEDRFQLSRQSNSRDPLWSEIGALEVCMNDILQKCIKAREPLAETVSALERINITELVVQCCQEIRSGFAGNDLSLNLDGLSKPHWATTFGGEVNRILKEILFSAIESSQQGDRIEIAVENRTSANVAADESTIDIVVRDSGPCITEIDRNRIVSGEAINTRRPIGMLAIAQRNAIDICAWIEVAPSADNQGNEVRLRIPLTSDDANSNC